MRNKTTIILVLVLIIGFAGFTGCNTYNRLVTQDEQVEASWADVQSQYQRRADLVPNLVNTVRGAADFERVPLDGASEADSSALRR